jgi:hypothetical protein
MKNTLWFMSSTQAPGCTPGQRWCWPAPAWWRPRAPGHLVRSRGRRAAHHRRVAPVPHDAWAGAHTAQIRPGLVPMAAAGAFTAASLAARFGCGCQQHTEQTSGAGTAAALVIHRFLEGSAIVLAGSSAVAVALAAHAFREGLASESCCEPSHAAWQAGLPQCASARSSAPPQQAPSRSRWLPGRCCSPWRRGFSPRPPG